MDNQENKPMRGTGNQLDAADSDLCKHINALIALDAAGALTPHGLGGHARELLTQASRRLAASGARPEDHNIRQLVNDLREIALNYYAAGQLRSRISDAVCQFIDANYSAHCRGRAQGGNTSKENGSDVAPTTSTVSAPETEAIECWSHDEEDFNARSLSEVLELHEDLKPGDTVWVGEAVHPDPAQLVNEDGIIENIGEAAYDIAGEHAEDYPEVTGEQRKELETLVADWIKRTCPPNFWTVENIKPYVLSHEDFPHDRTPVQLAEPDALRTTSTDQANADTGSVTGFELEDSCGDTEL